MSEAGHSDRPRDVQIFGSKGDAGTRKALRFFSERRVKTHFVELKKRAAAKGELLRFAQRFGVDALIDRKSPRFAKLGLASAHYSEDRWLQVLEDEPMLLRTPLVRSKNRLTVGVVEDVWRDWMEG